MTLFDGITSRLVDTEHAKVTVLERADDDRATPPERTVVFAYADGSADDGWQALLQDLPSDLRAVAVALPEGASGLASVLDDLDIAAAHLVSDARTAGPVTAHAREHRALSLTLEAPDDVDVAQLVGTPPILWIHTTTDAGSPDPQPRAALDAYRDAGGTVIELELDLELGVGDAGGAGVAAGALHRIQPAAVRRALLSVMGYIGDPASPAPPTEAIILSSSD